MLTKRPLTNYLSHAKSHEMSASLAKPDFTYERELFSKSICYPAGVDEAGRGALAGPVVAAAVIFDPNHSPIAGINDSKKISEAKRNALYEEILTEAVSVGVGVVSESTIDRINILQANLLAMREAVESLNPEGDILLLDGNQRIPSIYPDKQVCIKGGDALVYSIAAASIVAKVTRDRMMVTLDAYHPGFGFKQHKGYGTKVHREAIAKLGQSPVHRKSFTLKT